jgi:hypothetical protein
MDNHLPVDGLEAALMRFAGEFVASLRGEAVSVVHVFSFDGKEFTPSDIWLMGASPASKATSGYQRTHDSEQERDERDSKRNQPNRFQEREISAFVHRSQPTPQPNHHQAQRGQHQGQSHPHQEVSPSAHGGSAYHHVRTTITIKAATNKNVAIPNRTPMSLSSVMDQVSTSTRDGAA